MLPMGLMLARGSRPEQANAFHAGTSVAEQRQMARQALIGAECVCAVPAADCATLFRLRDIVGEDGSAAVHRQAHSRHEIILDEMPDGLRHVFGAAFVLYERGLNGMISNLSR